VLPTDSPDAILFKLAKYPCGNLAEIAEHILKNTGSRVRIKIKVPRVKARVSLYFSKRKPTEQAGNFWPGVITIYNSPSKKVKLTTLVHEMRHAQQCDALGIRQFCRNIAKSDTDILLNPLEIDAHAAEIANKTGKWFIKKREWTKGRTVNEVKNMIALEYQVQAIYTKQAEAIGR